MHRSNAGGLTVAIAHDFLGGRAGGERVALALADAFAPAPIHTLVYEPDATFGPLPDLSIYASWINRSATLRRRYRLALPVAALTFMSREVDADVVICSTSGLSHHIRCTGRKIVYCHTPARWLHDPDSYLAGFSAPVRTLAQLVSPAYRHLDRRAMESADQIIVNSEQIQREVRSIYGLDATVVTPTSSLSTSGTMAPIADQAPGFVLSVTRPLTYKRLDVLVAAARLLPDHRFVLIGDGPNRADVEATMPPNMISLGSTSDATLRWAYRNASVVALTCSEDYGLVPAEAAAFGKSTLVPNARGFATGDRPKMIRYAPGSVPDLVAAIEDHSTRLPTVPEAASFDGPGDVLRFAAEMREIVFAERRPAHQ